MGLYVVFEGFIGPLKTQLDEELIGVREVWGVLRGTGGYNIVQFFSEQSGGGRVNMYMKDFLDFIDDMELLDLLLEGGVFI